MRACARPRRDRRASVNVPLVVRVFTFSMLVALPASAHASADPSSPPVLLDKIVAVVNDDVILHSELHDRATQLAPQWEGIANEKERARRKKNFTRQLLNEMINEKLVVQSAKQANLSVKNREIRTAIDELKKQNNLDDRELQAALAQQGYTMDAYRNEIRRQLLHVRAVNMLVRPKVKVSDADLRAAYDEMRSRSGVVNKVKLHHVLISVPPNPTKEAVEAARARATMVIHRARSGEPFAKLVEQFSDDEDTKKDAGNLGWIERGSIATEWEKVVFQMEKNEIRGPIVGPHGFHVFQVTDVGSSDIKPFADVKEDLQKKIFRRNLEKETQTWIESLRKKAHIENRH